MNTSDYENIKTFQTKLKEIKKEIKIGKFKIKFITNLGNKLTTFINEYSSYVKNIDNIQLLNIETQLNEFLNEPNGDENNLYFDISFHFDIEHELDDILNNFNFLIK